MVLPLSIVEQIITDHFKKRRELAIHETVTIVEMWSFEFSIPEITLSLIKNAEIGINAQAELSLAV